MGTPRVTASLAGAGPKADSPSLEEAASSAWPLSEMCQDLRQCVCLGSDAMLSPVSVSSFLSVALCFCLSICASLCEYACTCVHADMSVCLHLPLAVFESACEPSSLSASASPVPSSGPGLSQVLGLWLWLMNLPRPAASPGVGECECLCVCPCACPSLICSLGKVLYLAGGVGPGGPR